MANAASKTSTEPEFGKVAAELGVAELDTKSKSADASAARANRQSLATATIRAAFIQKVEPETIHTTLLNAGVVKSTVSKIETVLAALKEGIITLGDVASMNGAYHKVRELRQIAYDAAHPAATTAAASTAGTTGPVKALTPKEAWAVILESIRADADPFKSASVWLTKTTNDITKLVRSVSEDDDDK